MNCATPCAPLRLTARGSNLLSCQIKRVKNSIGSSLAAAADCTAKQIDSRLGGSPGAGIRGLAAPSLGAAVSDFSDDRLASGAADWVMPGRGPALPARRREGAGWTEPARALPLPGAPRL